MNNIYSATHDFLSAPIEKEKKRKKRSNKAYAYFLLKKRRMQKKRKWKHLKSTYSNF